MKKTDYLLMSYLRQNARESLTRLSRKTKIPVSTIFDRLKTFENTIVMKHTSLIDFNRLGFGTRAKITLSCDKDCREGLKEHLNKHMSVNSLYKINNGYDFLVEGIFRDMKDHEDFLEELERFNIKEKKTYFIIEDLKRENFMTDPELLDYIIQEPIDG